MDRQTSTPALQCIAHSAQPGLLLLLFVAFVHVAQGQYPGYNAGIILPKKGSPVVLTKEANFILPKGYRLPPKADLSPHFPPPGNQHRQYSCSAWAMGYGLMSYRLNRLAGRTYKPTSTLDPKHTFSPAYLYNLMKWIDGSPCTSGCDMDKLAQYVALGGCCTWQEMPYDTALNSCKDRLADLAIEKEAMKQQTPPAVLLDGYNPAQWKYHLAEKRPIIMWFCMDTAFTRGGFRAGGDREFVWDLDTKCPRGGGHCVVCTGYDDADSTFTFINSFGPAWGHHGYFKATYHVLAARSGAGYVMTNDTARLGALNVADLPHDRTLSGVKVKSVMKVGDIHLVNDDKVSLRHVAKDHSTAVVHVFDTDSDTIPRTIHMEHERSYTIYQGDSTVTITYGKRNWLLRAFNRRVPVTITTGATAEDPYIMHRDEFLKSLE